MPSQTELLKAIYIEQRVQTIMVCELYARAHHKKYKWALEKYLEHYKAIEASLNKKVKKP